MNTIRSYKYQKVIDPLENLKLETEMRDGILSYETDFFYPFQKEVLEGLYFNDCSFTIMFNERGTLFCEEDKKPLSSQEITEPFKKPKKLRKR